MHGALNGLSGVPGLPVIYYGGNNDTSGLDGEGRCLKVTASTGTNPATGVTYTNRGTTQPIGSLTQVTLGSSDSDALSYDPNTGRMNQYQFNVGSQSVTGVLTWNANGSLGTLGITDRVVTANSQTCNYSHDDLARIAGVNCGTPWSQTFGYNDPFGNLTKSGTSSFQPTYSLATNRFLTVPGGTPTYDNNGNLTNDLSHTYAWDAEGKALSVDTVNLTYDALGRMVEQARGSSYTQIVYSPTGRKLALMNAQTLQKAFVALPGGATAVYTVSGLAYYRHADWLGSSRLATTPSRTKYYDVAYAPYGESYLGSGTADLNFTGQNQDTVSGLYDFLYREYHPVQGRWISPDPAGLAAVNVANPQSWNRYAYVANSPLNLVDPLGLSGTKPDTAALDEGWANWLWQVGTSGILVSNQDSIFVDGGCIGCTDSTSLLTYDFSSLFNQLYENYSPPLPQKGFCTLTIKVNNGAAMGADQLTSAEEQIDSLFGHSVGVDFVTSGRADYTLNFNNAGPGHTDLGHQTSFLFFQFSPVVHVNNISDNFSGWPAATINNIIGTVGAHELIHRITGITDLRYDPNNPNDLMSVGPDNPNAATQFVNNSFQLTANEIEKLANNCLQKHPN